MTARRSQGRVSATDAAVAWLKTTRPYADLNDYARATAGAAFRDTGFGLLARLVFGGPIPWASEVELECWQNWGEALYRYHLVLDLETAAARLAIDRGPLLIVLAQPPLRFRPVRADVAYPDPNIEIFATWKSLAHGVRTELEIEDVARRRLERRYLKGNSALFSSTARAWGAVRTLAELACWWADLEEKPPARSSDDRTAEHASLQQRIAARVTALEDMAREGALRNVGEEERADALERARMLRGLSGNTALAKAP